MNKDISINERIEYLTQELKQLYSEVKNSEKNTIYKELYNQELQWLEQLKELGSGRIQVLETSYSSSKNDEYMNAKLLGEVRGIKFMLGETTDTNYNHYSCNPEGYCDCCSPVHVDYEKEGFTESLSKEID